MDEGVYDINYLLKQRDNYIFIKTALTNKYYRVSCCASVFFISNIIHHIRVILAKESFFLAI